MSATVSPHEPDSPSPDPIQASLNDRPLRIALLGYRSNPYSGGQGVYLKYLSRALTALGHTVDVISGEPYPELDDGVRLVPMPGLNLFEAPNHVTALRPRHLLSATDFFEWFSMLTGGFPEPYTFGRRARHWLLRHGSYDIVHDNQSLSWGVLQLQRAGVPVITTVHHPITSDRDLALAATTTWQERLLIRRWHAFLRMQTRVARQLEHLVTVSHSSRRDIADAFGIDAARIHVVHNGIDIDDFRPLPHVPRQPGVIMATASADAPLKGLAVLLDALARVRRQMPDVRLELVGRPKPNGPTEHQIARLGLADVIRFHHGIDTTAIRELYARASLAVVPSLYEGFGLPAGEAMACGVPVVSSDGGALPEVVGDAGLLVPAGDPEALAGAITALLADAGERERLGRAGRMRIEQQFSWHTAARQMVALYRDVLLR